MTTRLVKSPSGNNTCHIRMRGSAFRHGRTMADIEHALSFAVAVVVLADGVSMFLGPDQSGRVLEVGVIVRDGEEQVLHAMTISRKYEKHLPR